MCRPLTTETSPSATYYAARKTCKFVITRFTHFQNTRIIPETRLLHILYFQINKHKEHWVSHRRIVSGTIHQKDH